MSSNKNKAATLFGLSFAGFAACIGLAFLAGGARSVPEQEVSLNLPEAETVEPPATVEPGPAVAAAEAAAPKLDPESVKQGKKAYEMYCLACHGPEGTSIDSPSNLFDPKWHHGDGRDGIELSIRKGIMEKGMPGWEAMISPEEINALVDYLLSFQKPAA